MQKNLDSWFGLLIGLICFQFVAGWKIMDPSYISWLWQDDPSQVFLTTNFYASEPWSRTPGLFASYGAGYSTSLVLGGAIPLLAIAGKLFFFLTGLPYRIFQLNGAWICSCFLLQGYFSWKIAELLGLSRFVSCIFCFLLCLAPPLLWRFDYSGAYHEILMAQWLLLWGYYLLLADRIRFTGRRYQWIALGALSIGIFFYLFVMVAALWAVWAWDRLREAEWRPPLKPVLRDALFALVAFGLIAWICGYFIPGSTVAPNFGYAKSTLLTFFIPNGFSSFMPFMGRLDSHILEYEGFAYLGFGVILGMLYLSLRRPSPQATMNVAQPHLVEPRLLIVLALTLGFAFTSNIELPRLDYITSLLVLINLWFIIALCVVNLKKPVLVRLIQSPLVCLIIMIAAGGLVAVALVPFLPEIVKASLRSSGRFSWLVWYWIVILFTSSAASRLGKREFTWLMTGVLAIQILDIAPAVIHGRQTRFLRDAHPAFNTAKLSAIEAAVQDHARGKTELVIIEPEQKILGWNQLGLIALHQHMSIDKAYFARMIPGVYKIYFNRRLAEVNTLTLDPEAIYLVPERLKDRIGAITQATPVIETDAGPFTLLTAKVP